MATLPNKPRAGVSLKEANLPDVIGKLIDYCRSITPRSSPTVKAFTGSAGTTFTVQRSRPGRWSIAESSYESFFRVVDASVIQEDGTRGDCGVGVTNGHPFYQIWSEDSDGNPLANSEICGITKVNGTTIQVLSVPHLTVDWQEGVSGRLDSVGTYYIWLFSWIDPEAKVNPGKTDAEYAHSIVIIGEKDDATPPDNPHGGFVWASQCLGRVVVQWQETIPAGPNGVPAAVPAHFYIEKITQDYLRGGEHTELLFSDCDGTIIECPETPQPPPP